MAPMAPMGKTRALALFDAGKLPIWMGAPHPHVMILEQDGMFRVRQLVTDPDESRAAFEEARKNRRSFMPENYAAMAKPTGKIYLEARSKAELRAKLESYRWPSDW